MSDLKCVWTASRGTEDWLANELRSFGLEAVVRRGFVESSGNFEQVAKGLVRSRIAMRCLMHIADGEAKDAEALYQFIYAIDWHIHIPHGATIAVEATIRDSAHNHSHFVALKCKDAIVDRLRKERGSRPNIDTDNPDVAIVLRHKGDQVSVSVDVAGAPLFTRGYRRNAGTASMKESLAAALLRFARYDGTVPFVDPMCGSGTLAIEAALIAGNRSPNSKRHFAAERWAHMEQLAAALRVEKQSALDDERPISIPIIARDRDEESIHAAELNFRAAKLHDVVKLELADVLHSPPPECPAGLLASNPPYGDRINPGGQKGMKAFYHHLGESMRKWTDWKCVFIVGNEAFESAYGQRPLARGEMFNGPIDCGVFIYGNRAPKKTVADS